jgi:SAM-dependent methyltransferase
MGCISKDGIPHNRQYIQEMEHALLDMMIAPRRGSVLEIGAGNGRLVPWFLRNGYQYTAVELSSWACHYMEEAYDVNTYCGDFVRDVPNSSEYDLIAAFHSLEHMTNAEAAFEKIGRILRPGGGFLYCGPEGTDLANPDHVWFWPPEALTIWLASCGLILKRYVLHSIQPHERTLFAYAVKA